MVKKKAKVAVAKPMPPKGFFARLFSKCDKKLEKKSKECSCGCCKK